MRYFIPCLWLLLGLAPIFGQPIVKLQATQNSFDLLNAQTQTNVLLDRAYGEISPLRGFSDRKTSYAEWLKIFSILQFGRETDNLFSFDWQDQAGVLQAQHQLPDAVGDPTRMDAPADLLTYIDHVEASPVVRRQAVDSLVAAFGLPDRTRLPEFQVVPVGIIFEPYEWLKNQAKKVLDLQGDSTLRWTSGTVAPNSPDLFHTDTVFVAYPLIEALPADTIVYYLDPQLIFSTLDPTTLATTIRIDFGDGKGPRPVKPGACYAVAYTRKTAHVRLKATIMNGQHTTRAVVPAFTENYRHQAIPANGKADTATCAASAPLYPHARNTTKRLLRRMSPVIQFESQAFNSANTVNAEMRILYAHTDEKLRKPFIIVTGYNPFPKSFSAFVKDYNSLQSAVASGLLTRLIEDGYDVCIFKPVSGVDYIENNALLLEKALNYINAEKAKNLPAGCMETCGAQNVAIGWSAGGLTVKLTLASMEARKVPHHTRLYLSWDGEHKGANIPLGVQQSLGYLADYTGPVMRRMIGALNNHRLLNSACAQELLALHYTQTGTPAAPAIGCSPLRTNFLAALSKVGGYPAICKAALAAGGSKGAPFTAPYYHFKNSEALFSGSSSRRKYSMSIVYHAAPNPNVFTAMENGTPQVVAVADTAGYHAWDNCPGSAFGKGGFMGILGIATGVYTRFQPGCAHISKATTPDCFVPVISALDLNTSDPYYNPSVKTPGSTPFDFTVYGTCQDQHNNGKMVEKAATFILDRVHATETCTCSPAKP